jgi:hypothetical protein
MSIHRIDPDEIPTFDPPATPARSVNANGWFAFPRLMWEQPELRDLNVEKRAVVVEILRLLDHHPPKGKGIRVCGEWVPITHGSTYCTLAQIAAGARVRPSMARATVNVLMARGWLVESEQTARLRRTNGGKVARLLSVPSIDSYDAALVGAQR